MRSTTRHRAKDESGWVIHRSINRVHDRIRRCVVEHKSTVFRHESDAQRQPLRANLQRLQREKHETPHRQHNHRDRDLTKPCHVFPNDSACFTVFDRVRETVERPRYENGQKQTCHRTWRRRCANRQTNARFRVDTIETNRAELFVFFDGTHDGFLR
jgi:hypothetical protein